MNFQVGVVLARKLTVPYHRSTTTVKRKIGASWVVVATGVRCNVLDSSDRPPRPDGHDAGTDNVRTWEISFLEGQDIQMRDQLWETTTVNGDVLPVLTVATNFQTDVRSSHWVVCHAEDSAVAMEPVSFYREHEVGSTTTSGPYMCVIDFEDITGRDPTNLSSGAHLTFVVLTGPWDMDVAQLDFVSDIDGLRGGQVIEVRKAVGERKEVRVQIDSGYRG